MWIKNLISFRGYKLDIHKFIGADDKECYHTHPAKCFRLVVWGGYIEELESGDLVLWPPLRAGIVRPELSHRIAGTIFNFSYSVWFRFPKTAAIELHGSGWNNQIHRMKPGL